MKRNILHSLMYVCLSAITLSGCGIDAESGIEREGYHPVYLSAEDAGRIAILPAQPLKQPGKIYSKDTLVLINELSKGIHVINNKDPRNPQNIAFVSIPGNVDMAIKGSTLYADNFTDLVVLNLTNPKSITLIKRVTKALPEGIQNYPPYTNVYFECVDPTKGVVVGWEKAMLKNPKCRR